MGNSQKTSAREPSDYEEISRPGQPDCSFSAGLTDYQTNQIRKLWQHARKSGRDEPGRSIYQAIFSRHSDIRDVFKITASRTSKVYLAQQFNRAWDTIIQDMHDKDKVDIFLHNLGRLHYRRARLDGFKPEFWTVFAEVMIHKTIHWGHKKDRNAQSQLAWTSLVFYVIEKLKEGYYAARKDETKRSRSMTPSLGRPIKTSSGNLPISRERSRSDSTRTLDSLNRIHLLPTPRTPNV